MEKEFGGIILAGGRGVRLGGDKVNLKLHNRLILDLVIERLKLVASEIIVVTSEQLYDKITKLINNLFIVTDMIPNKAALGGIFTGLKYTSKMYNFVVACDMPFLNPGLLNYMSSICVGYDAIVPRVDDYIEPLHSIYSKRCLDQIYSLISNNNLNIFPLFSILDTKFIEKEEIAKYDPEFLSFFNINTMADLNKAEEIMRTQNNNGTLMNDKR